MTTLWGIVGKFGELWEKTDLISQNNAQSSKIMHNWAKIGLN